MNTLPTPPSSVAQLLIPAGQPLPPARRLLVLVPDDDLDETKLAQQIWTLASPRHLAVIYIGLTHGPQTESHARRRLATLAASTRDEWVNVQTRLEIGADWGRAVRALWRPGDLVVCHAEQTLSRSLTRLWPQPLGQALLSTLKAPVYLLSGFYQPLSTTPTKLPARLWSWLIPLAILIGFFFIQVQIEQQVIGWLKTMLLSASVALEFGLIGLWNSLST